MTKKDHRLARTLVGIKGTSFSDGIKVLLYMYLLLLLSLIYKFYFLGKKLKRQQF